MEYLTKLEENPYGDFYWNVPEVKQGVVNVVGGSAGVFRAPVKITEEVLNKFPVAEARMVVPDALRVKLPPLPNIVFLGSTGSGSFESGSELSRAIDGADFNLLVGDLSKNAVTMRAIVSAVQNSARPLLITRDAVDVLAEECREETLMRENLIIFGSMAQLVKVFRALYYPKMLLLTQPLMQVAEALHKFTLSYPATIITLHMGQVLVAKDGEVVAVPLEKVGFSPIMIWNGELAAKIMALNLYNPGKMLEASVAALFR